MLAAPFDDVARTAIFAETLISLKRNESSRFEALLLTDANLAVVGGPPLPAYLNDVVEVAAGRLTARKRENLSRLCAAVDAAMSRRGPQSVPFKLSTDDVLVSVYGAVERVAFATETPLVLFSFVHPSARIAPCPEKLSVWFGLSKAENLVALELLAGKDIAEIATEKNLSELTVRAQLRSIFEKTNTHSQRDLVALLLRLASI